MDETLILSREGGITKHFDLRLAGPRIYIVYADHIEPPLARRWKSPKVISHHGGHQTPLVPIDSCFPGLHIARGSRLDFHEAKNIVVPSDQVNLSPGARRAKVSRHHGVAQFPQMKVSRLFPAPPSAMMRRNLLRRQSMLRQPVEEAKRRLRQLPREWPPGKNASRKHEEIPKLTVTGRRPVGCALSNNYRNGDDLPSQTGKHPATAADES
jgi:hypothetical protein